MLKKTILFTVVIISITALVEAGPINLPETGQTTSYVTGDDGNLLRGVAWPNPRFTAGTGAETECIADELTGLMWPKDGNLPAGTKTWIDALTYANDLTYCGYSDWRLPNVNELDSIVNAEHESIATWLNGQGFTNIMTQDYWSATTYAPYSEKAWIVHLQVGLVLTRFKVLANYVWPVRAGQFGDADISLSTASLDFGNVAKGGNSDMTVTVTNNGTNHLDMGSVASINGLAAPFSIITDNCSGQTVQPLATCTIDVRFALTADGSFSDSFDIPSNDPDTPSMTVNVSGSSNTAPLSTPQTVSTNEDTDTGITLAGTDAESDPLS